MLTEVSILQQMLFVVEFYDAKVSCFSISAVNTLQKLFLHGSTDVSEVCRLFIHVLKAQLNKILH